VLAGVCMVLGAISVYFVQDAGEEGDLVAQGH
jgi:maltose/moltooligosaccharide transporter